MDQYDRSFLRYFFRVSNIRIIVSLKSKKKIQWRRISFREIIIKLLGRMMVDIFFLKDPQTIIICIKIFINNLMLCSRVSEVISFYFVNQARNENILKCVIINSILVQHYYSKLLIYDKKRKTYKKFYLLYIYNIRENIIPVN